MTKNIFEDLPARKHAPAAAAPSDKEGGKKEGGEGGSEKRIRQAVYDIRYRARREGIDLRAAYSQYMQNSNLSAPEQAAVRAKLFGKDGGGDKKESYDAMMNDGATGTVADAMFKVFVEKIEKQPVEEDAGSERKYKVRVTDPKTEKSYVRYANRSKITELRAKGLKVEMTEHGEPYEGEKKKGGKMDPVAKNPKDRDGDVNNDGKKDGTDKYIYARRDAINAAIKKRRGMKEEFLVDGTTSTEGQGRMVPDGKVNNYAGKKPVVTINPDSEIGGKNLRAHKEVEGELIAEKAVSKSQQRFMGMVCAYKKGEMENASDEVVEAAKNMSKEDACDFAGTKHDKLPEKVSEEKGESCPKCKKCPCECGYMDREKRTYRELLKNKLRAMGIKNPMMLGAPEDGEAVMKIMTSQTAKMTSEARVLAQQGGVPGTVEVKKTKEGGFLGIGAKTVSKPVPGTFTPKDVSSQDAARYNQAIDNRFKGHSGPADQTPATAIQRAAQRKGHSGYMKVKDPSSIPNTGIPNRPTPARSSDQNDAMSWQVGNKFKK